MNLSSFCIRHKVMTIMIYITLAIFGIMSFKSLALSLMPSMEIPIAVVYTTYPNAGPEEVENNITDPVEGAAAGISGVDEIQSTSSENLSMVIIQFDYDVDLDVAVQDLRDSIAQIESTLPDDANSPTIMKLDPDMMPVTTYALTGADLEQMQAYAEDTLEPALKRIEGVASVDIMGGYTPVVQITMDTEKMQGYGLSVSYLSQVLSAENINIPAGDVDNGSQTMTVRTEGQYASVDELRNTVIPLPAGGSVYLSEVANVVETHEDVDSIVKVGTTPGVTIAVNKQSGSNTVSIAEAANQVMEDMTKEQGNFSYLTVLDQSDYVNKTVSSVIQNIVLGVLLAVVVLFFFLRDVGATSVIAISMPMCIVFVFLIMKAMGVTMNMMSLGGMAMGVGMIVDNSIVILENIYRYRADGFTRFDSCVQGSAEMVMSVVASTLTTVAVFLPLALTGGMSGMMFKDFCLTIVSLLGASLFIALTLVPLLCYTLLDRRGQRTVMVPKEAQKPKYIAVVYNRLLRTFITKRKIGVVASLVMIVIFVIGIATCDVQLIPEMDQSQISVTIDMPTGTDLDDTTAMSDRVVGIVEKAIPDELDSLYYQAGSSGMSMSSGSNSSSMTINLVPIDERDRSSAELGEVIRKKLDDVAGAEFTISTSGSMDMSSMSGSDIDITISGDDYDTLGQISNDLTAQIEKLPGALNVESSMSDQVPRVNITLNRAVAARYGLTTATVGSAIRTELTGSTSTTLKIDGEEMDVEVKGDEVSATSLDALKSVPLSLQSGGTIPLSEVADVQVELAPQSIVRDNQTRTVTITGDKADSVKTSDMSKAVQQVLDDYDMPEGYTAETGGTQESMKENFSSLGLALLVAVFLVYLILASQFESFILPVMVMMILPTGLLGGLFALPVTRNPISMTAMIGVIMLAGTIVNSSIVLVDYIQTRRRRGEDKNTAILNACPRRVRPVLMTALTTILGNLPMALGMGEGSEMMQAMAWVMIFGMTISTIVTLLFTPVYYSLLDSLAEHFRSRSRRRLKKKLIKQKDKAQSV